jgi:sorbitol-specific phosphotransferase system component IIBC
MERAPNDPVLRYRTVRVRRGVGGWGTELFVRPTESRPLVASNTAGGIHPVAQQIAKLACTEAVDVSRDSPPHEAMACVVIDCAGTARSGMYPKLGVRTVNVLRAQPSGPYAQYATERLFVSGVTVEDVSVSVEEARSTARQASGGVRVRRGPAGWGSSFVLAATERRRFVLSSTGSSIHPVAERIAELLEVEAIDAFARTVGPDELVCVVISDGGGAHLSAYARSGIPVVNTLCIGPSGPFAEHVTEALYVSGVRVSDIG